MAKSKMKTFTVEVSGETYTCRKLSGFRMMNALGDPKKQTGDLYRDLILASVQEPEITKEYIEEEMPPNEFLALGVGILQAHEVEIQDFPTTPNGNMR